MVDPIVLDFRDPMNLNPFNAKNVDGLDAGPIVARYYKQSGIDNFYDLTLEARKVVVKIGLNPDFAGNVSYSDLRDHIYRIIGASKTGQVQLVLVNGTQPVAVVSGFVSKVETSIFEKVQEVQLTIDCDDPLLRSPIATIVNVATLGFTDTVIADTDSTAPHGFSFRLKFTSPLSSLVITDPTDATWSFRITPVDGFHTNDVLYFSSEFNQKHLYIVRGATAIDLLSRVTLGSVWPIMFPGENHFSLNTSALDWVSFNYYKTYWGV